MGATSDVCAAGLASSSFPILKPVRRQHRSGPLQEGLFIKLDIESSKNKHEHWPLFAGNNVTSNLKWDLGGRNVILGLLKVLKFSDGRFLELGASYSDKTQLLTVEAAGKPHKEHKLAAA